MEHPPGLVGILTGELGRYSTFWESLIGQVGHLPHGSNLFPIHSQWTADAINGFIDVMQPHHQWLHIWANDHEFQADVALRLLDRQVAVVAPLCVLRSPPNHFSLFHEREDSSYQSYAWDELEGKHGLLAVDAMGGPGVLIRREVIEAMGQPFWQNDPRGITNPREDLYSFSRLRKAGFQPYCDLDLWIGHCTVLSMYPVCRRDGAWGVSYYEGEYYIGSLFGSDVRQRQTEGMAVKTDPSYHVFMD